MRQKGPAAARSEPRAARTLRWRFNARLALRSFTVWINLSLLLIEAINHAVRGGQTTARPPPPLPLIISAPRATRKSTGGAAGARVTVIILHAAPLACDSRNYQCYFPRSSNGQFYLWKPDTVPAGGRGLMSSYRSPLAAASAAAVTDRKQEVKVHLLSW